MLQHSGQFVVICFLVIYFFDFPQLSKNILIFQFWEMLHEAQLHFQSILEHEVFLYLTIL